MIDPDDKRHRRPAGSSYLRMPHLFPTRSEGSTGSTELIGATQCALRWEIHGKGVLVLIDVGDDGVAGKYVFEQNQFRSKASDTNGDWVDDATDDVIVGKAWGSIVQ